MKKHGRREAKKKEAKRERTGSVTPHVDISPSQLSRLPNYATSRPLRHSLLVEMQQRSGNSYVQRELIQRRKGKSQQRAIPRDLGAQRGKRELAGPVSVKDLELSGALTDDAPMEVSDFIWEYNLFLQPVRMTVAALGRVQDLAAADVPFSPAVMSEEQKKTVIDPKKIEAGLTDYTLWSKQQVDMEQMFRGYVSKLKLLKGSLYQLESAMSMIAAHRKQAQLSNETEQLNKIVQSAARLKKIVDYVELGYGYANKLDGLMGFKASGDKLSPTNKDVLEGAAGKIWSHAKANEDITLGLLIVASGQAKEYLNLEKEINGLLKEISFLEDKSLELALHSAKETVAGWKLDADPKYVAELMLKQVTFARHHARDFAKKTGGDLGTAEIMMMAEAFQELAGFGSYSLEFVGTTGLDSKAAQVQAYLERSKWPYLRGRSEGEIALEDPYNINYLRWDTQKCYLATRRFFSIKSNLEEKVPLWEGFAQQWRDYLSELVGRNFEGTPGR